MLCSECGTDYAAYIKKWREDNGCHTPMDYPDFSVWINFLKSKGDKLREHIMAKRKRLNEQDEDTA